MADFPVKDWRDYPNTTTPITAVALEDMERRLSDYTDDAIQTFAEEGGEAGGGGGGGGALPPRLTTSFSTASLAAGAGASGFVTLATGIAVLRVTTNRASRVRLYATAAQRDADIARGTGADPTGDHGCFLEVLFGATVLAYSMSPIPFGYSMEAAPVPTIPYRVDNLAATAGVVTVGLTWQQFEIF